MGKREKCTPKSGKISPLILSPIFVNIVKIKNYWGWATSRAIGSRPLCWNTKVWSPYGSETKWHPRLVFLPISQSILIILSIANVRPVVSRHNIWPLKYVPNRRKEWTFYGLSTTKRRRTCETKNIYQVFGTLCVVMSFSVVFFVYQTHRATRTYGYLGAEKMNEHFWLHGP